VHLVRGNPPFTPFPPLEKVEPNLLIFVLVQPFLKRVTFILVQPFQKRLID
jgi:hypothetical protein